MDSTELLAKQIQQYQEQNERDHDMLNKKIDQLLAEIHVLFSERNVNEKRFDNLEEGQKEIKEVAGEIDKRVKSLEEHHLKRDHLVKWIIKGLGVASVIAGLIATAWKFGFF